MHLTKQQIQQALDALPKHYKTADVDRLIRQYVKQKADVSGLRPYILDEQQFHRIYYYVSLEQISSASARMAFIHKNLLFSDWWHTDQIISYVADLNFDMALDYAKNYIPPSPLIFSFIKQLKKQIGGKNESNTECPKSYLG